MSLAKIFRPIRWPSVPGEAVYPPPALPDGLRALQMGTQPVTNLSPSGVSSASSTSTELKEEGWLALLELVFDETGWPDAD
jgi:hypothetical protein